MRVSSHVPRTRRAGFTLVELLVVIGIMVVLAGLLLPAILKAREASRSIKCASNLRQIGFGAMRFYDINGNYPPYRWENNEQKNPFGVDRPRWQWIISDLVGRPAQNPDLVAATLATDPTCTNIPLDNEIFFCPSLADGPNAKSIRSGSYGYNFMYLGNSRNMTDGDATTPYINYPIRTVKDPSRTVAFADSRGGNVPHGGHSMTLDAPHMRVRPTGTGNVNSPSPNTTAGCDPYGPDETGTDIVIYYSPVEARHNGRGNVVFLDGHVESLNLEQLGYVVVNGVAQPQAPGATNYGALNNGMWTGVGLDEASPNYGNIP